jgi:hypothetical protein
MRSCFQHWVIMSVRPRLPTTLCKDANQLYTEYAIILTQLDACDDCIQRSQYYMDEAVRAGGVDNKILGNFLATAEKNRVGAVDIPHEDPFRMMQVRRDLKDVLEPLLDKLCFPSWKTALSRHIEKFQWPIPNDLVEDMQCQIQEARRLSNSSDDLWIEEKRALVVGDFACLQIPVYSLEDCVFASRVAAERDELKVDREKDVVRMLPRDFEAVRHLYPLLGIENSTTPLHVGLFSGDIRPHPMLPLIAAFLKYQPKNVKITLYHEGSDQAYLGSLLPYVDEDFGFEKADWKMALRHAREKQIHVWLDTSGRTGTGASRLITAARPAPVDVLWGGFPSSMAATK